jgi:hypothetical protein
VFLSVPGIGNRPGETNGLRIFVFDAETLAYLGSAVFDSLLAIERLLLKNIRRCLCVNGSMYMGLAAKNLDDDKGETGIVLRWKGNRQYLFDFEIVARIPEPVNKIFAHGNHLYVHTWPSVAMNEEAMDKSTIKSVSSIYMSPRIPASRL